MTRRKVGVGHCEAQHADQRMCSGEGQVDYGAYAYAHAHADVGGGAGERRTEEASG